MRASSSGLSDDVRGGHVLVDVGGRARSRDGHHALVLVEQPGQGELGRGDPALRRELAQRREAVAVAREVLGLEARRVAAKVVVGDGVDRAPARKPLPSGPQATGPAPSSRTAGSSSRSGVRVHSDHSNCTAASGRTRWAAMAWSAVTLHSPIQRALPAATRSAIAPTLSSTGTPGSGKCRYQRSTWSVPSA